MTAARSDLMALDPLEMLLDAARFADSIKPEWAKAARKAVAAARLAASQPDRKAVGRIVHQFKHQLLADQREYLIDAILSLLSGAGTKSDGGFEPFGESGGSIYPWERGAARYAPDDPRPPDLDIDANNAEADRQIAEDVLNWLKARGLYDPRDYECEGPDVAELLTEHEENLQKPSDPPPGPDVREAARACADDLINIVEAAQRAANRTGNTFVLDRERVAGMIAGKFSALTRPLGGFVQGSIARKQSTDPEGSSRTETALAIFSALSKAGIEHSAISCNGVNLFGDRKSIEASRAWLHSHGQIDDLKTNLRHWRDECGKLHSKLAVAETDADAQRDDGLLRDSLLIPPPPNTEH